MSRTELHPLHPPRRILMGPGPSNVHPRVYEALGKSLVGHILFTEGRSKEIGAGLEGAAKVYAEG